MNAINFSFGLLVVVFITTVLLVRWIRKPKPKTDGFQAQRMCPSCGLITPRQKACCLECGKPFPAVEYSISKK
jgi:hypothetical protein